MNAPAFPLNPTVGQRFQDWVWNGSRWVCSPAAGVQVITTVFTASAPYMPSPGLVSVQVECLGAGGGGGCAVGQATYLGSGGGGGSGGYSTKTLPAAIVAGGVAVTIGVGGLGGIAPGNATAGSATSFGALCVANGGSPGLGVGNGGMGDGGMGGAAAGAVGDVTYQGSSAESGNIVGTPGAGSFAHSATGGQIFGGNNRGPNFGAGGTLVGASGHPNSGSGGSGGAYNETTVDANGGNGASGICIVTEYCWADVANDDCCTSTVNVNARVTTPSHGWSGGGQFGGEE